MTPDTQNFGSSVLDFPPIITMYIPDTNLPYYIEFPKWQDPHFSPKTPKNWKWDEFYVPPLCPRKNNENHDEALKGVFKKLRGELEPFSQTKDGLKFRLELAGFAKDEISVTVGENKYLNVNSKLGPKPLNKVFTIPNAENYNLANPTAQMSNGLLEISFAAKKEEVRVIKIL